MNVARGNLSQRYLCTFQLSRQLSITAWFPAALTVLGTERVLSKSWSNAEGKTNE